VLRHLQADDDRVIARFDELNMPVNLGQPFWVTCHESTCRFERVFSCSGSNQQPLALPNGLTALAVVADTLTY
jgi:hypothetical protein